MRVCSERYYGLGWLYGKYRFSVTAVSDTEALGKTRIFVINCDLSGQIYNSQIPVDPNNLMWVYQLDTKVDVWN